MAHTDSCEQGFACNAYYKLYYYIKLFRKVKQFFKNTTPFARKNQIFCVRGNCDTEVDQMVLEFPVLADYALILEGGRCFYLTHGHHYNPQNLPPLNPGDVLINGHTHVFKAECVNGIHCLNDGSVSLPKEGKPRSYMLYENGVFTIKQLETGVELLTYALNG